MELFYQEIEAKRQEDGEKMRLQTNLQFHQNEIKRLNEKYNVGMLSSKVRGGKTFAAKQKIREFKKLLFKSKKLHKASKTSRVNPCKIDLKCCYKHEQNKLTKIWHTSRRDRRKVSRE